MSNLRCHGFPAKMFPNCTNEKVNKGDIDCIHAKHTGTGEKFKKEKKKVQVQEMDYGRPNE